MKTVMVFGTFDIIHCGHLHMFEEAKGYGEKLIVVVGRDVNVEKVKGNAPIHGEADRLKLISELRIVDKAILGDQSNVYKVVGEEKPDVIALGYDQKVYVDDLSDAITELGLQTRIVKLSPYQQDIYKSSKIKSYIEKLL